MKRNIAVIGNGGREHALCWKLSKSSSVKEIYVISGNGGTSRCDKVTNVDINICDFKQIITYLKQHSVSLVIVGPEVPLAKGIADELEKNKILCFGPTAQAARIESDKEWAKRFMDKYHIPTARWKSFKNANDAKEFIKNASYRALVVKATGLAGGKGVTVAKDTQDACSAVDSTLGSQKFSLGAADVIVVEELVEGEEVSVLAFTDGRTVKAMLPVQDHKRLLDGDNGPNTGGMGAFCPFALSNEEMEYIEKEILQKTINGLKSEQIFFKGVLYAGLMMTNDGVKVLEYNCRFGDPETQVLMPLLESDLFDVIEACCLDTLHDCEVMWKQDKYCVTVVMTCQGYPDRSSIQPVAVEDVSKLLGSDYKLVVFHGNTKISDNKCVAFGGRALNVTAVDDTLLQAAIRATKGCDEIHFDGKHYRRDIAQKGVTRNIVKNAKLTYKSAGVDISSASEIIKKLKPLIESTYRGNIISSIGSFGAVIDPELKNYKNPVLITGTDGVGTKLKIAQRSGNPTAIGQDLVAMSVNDILALGAKPLFFLDYFACGKLEPEIVEGVVKSIVEGCKNAGCALVGGETAEMPGFYRPGEYDLAGFAVGIVERELMLPCDVKDGDKILYIPSSGLHSNGYSLVRKILNDRFEDLHSIAPFSTENLTFEQELLKPTRIYTNEILPLVDKKLIKAFAHITGGGLLENVDRVLPSNLKVNLNATLWDILPIFGWIAAIGGVCEEEMLRTFNCGVGAVLIVDPKNAKKVARILQTNVIGEVVPRHDNKEQQVNVQNFRKALSKKMDPYLPILLHSPYIDFKRVAVFISGTGTNLKALIENIINDVNSPARIVYVISSRARVKGLEIAARYGIPAEVIPRKKGIPLSKNDEPRHNALIREKIDIVCLAGYMHILSDWFVGKWRGKCLNIHPSLLPSFKGLHPQAQALKAGVKFSGCSVHFVEPELDAGPIIDQAIVPVLDDDTEESLAERIKEQEHKLYPRVLRMVASGEVSLDLQTDRVVKNSKFLLN